MNLYPAYFYVMEYLLGIRSNMYNVGPTSGNQSRSLKGGGSPCRMSIMRNGNVTLSNLRKPRVTLSIFEKCRVTLSKVPYRMSLRPKKGRVAMSILGVYTHTKSRELVSIKYITFN